MFRFPYVDNLDMVASLNTTETFNKSQKILDIAKAFWIIAFVALGIYVISLILTCQWPDYRKTDWEKKIEEDYKKDKDFEEYIDRCKDLDRDDLPY
jgi:hypothetical protein